MIRLETLRQSDDGMLPHHILVLNSGDLKNLISGEEIVVTTEYGGNVVIAWEDSPEKLPERFGVTEEEVETGTPIIDFDHESC